MTTSDRAGGHKMPQKGAAAASLTTLCQRLGCDMPVPRRRRGGAPRRFCSRTCQRKSWDELHPRTEQGELFGLTSKSAPAGYLHRFHARAHVTAEEAAAGEKKAQRQEELIVEFFRSRPLHRYAPSHVWEYFGRKWPITSVRRAITNATSAGYLAHYPGDRVPGPFGAKEGTWGATSWVTMLDSARKAAAPGILL